MNNHDCVYYGSGMFGTIGSGSIVQSAQVYWKVFNQAIEIKGTYD